MQKRPLSTRPRAPRLRARSTARAGERRPQRSDHATVTRPFRVAYDPDPRTLLAFVDDTAVAAFPIVAVLEGLVSGRQRRDDWILAAATEGGVVTGAAVLHRRDGYALFHTVEPRQGAHLVASLVSRYRVRVLAGEADSAAVALQVPAVAERIWRVEHEHFMVLRAFEHRVEPDGNYRPAQRKDIPVLRAYATGYSSEHNVPFVADWEYEVACGNVMVAEALPPHPPGQIAACLMRGVTAGPYALCSAVYTFPRFRGQGYAQRLVANFCLEAALAGLDPCLYVGTSNAPALAAYRKVGFVPVDDYYILHLRPPQVT